MKKSILKLAIAGLAGFSLLTSCKKADEVTPTAGKPSVTVEFLNSNYGVEKDFDVSTTVSTTGDTAFINIKVDGTQDMDKIYMTYQKDNDQETKFTTFPNGTSIPSAGYSGTDLSGGNPVKFDYSGGTFNIKSALSKGFKITIPVLLRNTTTAKSDVFKIWITQKGTLKFGDHKNPAKNIAYGVAFVKLNYTNEALISNYETVLGSSLNDSIGSIFSTSTGSNYTRAYAQDTLKGAGVDFVFNNYTSGKFTLGSFFADATTLNADVAIGFKGYPATTNLSSINRVIKLAEVSSSAWDGAVGETSLVSAVNAVSTFTSFVTYNADPTGKVLAFITADGKKGLIKVVSISNANTKGGAADVQVKVQR